MPVIVYAPFGPTFYGENAARDAYNYEIDEAKSGDVHFYQRHRRKLVAEFEATTRAQDAFLADAKIRSKELGERIDAFQAQCASKGIKVQLSDSQPRDAGYDNPEIEPDDSDYGFSIPKISQALRI